MLKISFTGKKAGKPLKGIVFGLSYTNLERLKDGQPIVINGDEVRLPGYEILIFSGPTEQSMAREIHELIGPNTQVHIDPRLKD
jgi:hypothetical protein